MADPREKGLQKRDNVLIDVTGGKKRKKGRGKRERGGRPALHVGDKLVLCTCAACGW